LLLKPLSGERNSGAERPPVFQLEALVPMRRLPTLIATLALLTQGGALAASDPKELARCAALKNDVVRLACFDEIAKSAGVAAPKVEKSLTPGKWVVRTEVSPLDDSTNAVATLEGDAEIRGWLQSAKPLLIVRCKENQTEAYVVTGMNANVESGDLTTVTLRFDKGQAFSVGMNKSTDGEALFFTSPVSMIKQMLGHERLLFQFTPFNASPTMTTFALSGISEAIAPVREHCSW